MEAGLGSNYLNHVHVTEERKNHMRHGAIGGWVFVPALHVNLEKPQGSISNATYAPNADILFRVRKVTLPVFSRCSFLLSSFFVLRGKPLKMATSTVSDLCSFGFILRRRGLLSTISERVIYPSYLVQWPLQKPRSKAKCGCHARCHAFSSCS